MKPRVLILPDAERDIADAHKWYEERSPRLGSEFLRAVEVCMAAIERNPQAHPIVHKQVRRALLRRFPYGIFYLVQENTIPVLACFHGRRDPKVVRQRAE